MYNIDTLKRERVGTNAYNLQASLGEKVVVDGHSNHTVLKFGVKAIENQDQLPINTGYLHSIISIKTLSSQIYCQF